MSETTELIAQQILNGNINKRTWGDLIFNVKVYGAKGDGVSDDTVFIAKALSDASVKGGVVLFPPGTYIKSGQLSVKPNVTIRGSGVGATTIKVSNNAVSTSIFVLDNFASNVDIEDMTLDGNRDNQATHTGYLIFGYRCHDINIQRVHATKSSFQGIGFSNGHNVTLRDCRSDYNYYMGIWLSSDLNIEPYITSNNIVENCDCHYNDLDGLLVASHHVTVTNSRFTYNGQDVHGNGALGAAGIYSEGLIKFFRCINNYVALNTEYGVNVCCEDGVIADNTCEFNALTGINIKNDATGPKRLSIANNTCSNNGTSSTVTPVYASKSGISLDKGDSITLVGNICYDNQTVKTQRYGIDAFDFSGNSSNVTLSGNQLQNNLVGDESVSSKTTVTPQFVNDISIKTKAWTAASLQNAWVNFGSVYANAGFYKDANGFVHLRGLIKSGTAAGGTTLFTLPAGYRPAFTVAIVTFSSDGTVKTTGIEVSNAGAVQIASTGAGNTYLALDGISFRADI
jgi:hypothetical protein